MLKVAVVRFPGSNCDFDALRAAERVGADAYFVWHRDTSLQGADVVILPGGFSYGDYLRSGAIARFSPIMQAVQRHAAEGGAGARHLQRLPDPVRGAPAPRRADAERGPHVRLEAGGRRRRARPTPSFTSAYAPGTRLRLPVAHGDGRFVAADDTLRMLEAEGRVVLRYVPSLGGLAVSAQPQRLRQPHRGHLQRRGHRGRHHAASRARRRPAPRDRRTGSDSSLPSRPGSRATPCSGFPANDDRQAQPQRRRVLRQAGRRAAPEAAGPGRGRRVDAERKTHFMKCPKDGYDLASSDLSRRADRDLPALRRDVARCGRAGGGGARGAARPADPVLTDAFSSLPPLATGQSS